MFPLLVEGFHGDTARLQLLIGILSLPFHTQSLAPTNPITKSIPHLNVQYSCLPINVPELSLSL